MISIVIPVYNEKDSLALLYEEIEQTAQHGNLQVEVVFVDDGSRDGSWDVIRELAKRHVNIRAIRFRRNFGKAAALSAGFGAATGDIVLTMDADLQDDPAEIPRFLEKLATGLDVVSGWKQTRYDPWHKVLPSRVFNALVSRLTGVRLHDHNCGMKAYRRDVLGEIRLYGELHRFIPVLAAAKGYRVGEIVIHHRPRRFGSSKYGVKRFVKGFLDLLTVRFLTRYRQRPQHFLGGVGLLFLLLGSFGLTYQTLCAMVPWINETWSMPLANFPWLPLSLTAVILGVQILSFGFLAELVTANTTRDADAYSVAEVIGNRKESPQAPG
jgi:glycosyltransferase involved in cell wall biosynthesis